MIIMKVCENCGKINPKKEKFCFGCQHQDFKELVFEDEWFLIQEVIGWRTNKK